MKGYIMVQYIFDKQKIRQLMKLRGFNTQRELAVRMGISPEQLSLLLSHRFNPIKNNACKLGDILGSDDILKAIISDDKKVSQKNVEPYDDTVDVNDIKPKNKYTAVELFAGAGGLALGLEKAGFDELGLVEIDKNASATLKQNRPNWNVINEDITKITDTEGGIYNYIPKNQEFDLLSGGYPCQSFSYSGKRLGLNDTRGTLFYNYAKILQQLKPKMFLVENVKGLTTMDHGRTLQTMIDVFSSVGYHITYRVLNAWDYGVAEKRQRMILIGIRNDLNIKYRFPKPHKYKPVLRDVLQNVPKSPGISYSKRTYDVLRLIPAGGYWKDLPEDVAKAYMGKSWYSGGGKTGMARRLSWDEPSLTLTTSPSQKQTERCHPDETRPFTTREYARIQSFPDSWQFAGSVSSIYKQIGNAVAVNFARDVGLSIIDALNQLYD